MAFTGQLSTRRKTSTTSLPRASSSILSSSIANLVQNAPSRNTLIQFLSLSLSSLFLYIIFQNGTWLTRWTTYEYLCISIWGERKGKKMSRSCNKKRWLSRKLENSSRSPFSSSCSPSSSAKISGGCCQEYFVAEETSLVRASLREDRDTLSGFNGQCPLRRKFRGTLVPKFAGSQGARHRGLVPLGYRPLSAKYRSGHVSNPEEHVSLMQPRRQF